VRPEAGSAIASPQRLGITVAMLTGENIVAKSLGISDVFAQLLPDGKAQAIARLRQHAVVAMVGDGINDAPALAEADLAMAMATGTDIAMHAAGITLMRGDPRLVPAALDIARRSWRKIRQGLFWAFVYNAVGIPLAAAGLLSPVLAGAAMALSSVSAVGNALLLRRWKPET
jgi:Cu+-exporting ATPase